MNVTVPSIQQMLQEMHDAGWSDRAIGDAVGLKQSTIWRLRSGAHKDTRHQAGQLISALWIAVTVSGLNAPKRSRALSERRFVE